MESIGVLASCWGAQKLTCWKANSIHSLWVCVDRNWEIWKGEASLRAPENDASTALGDTILRSL